MGQALGWTLCIRSAVPCLTDEEAEAQRGECRALSQTNSTEVLELGIRARSSCSQAHTGAGLGWEGLSGPGV